MPRFPVYAVLIVAVTFHINIWLFGCAAFALGVVALINHRYMSCAIVILTSLLCMLNGRPRAVDHAQVPSFRLQPGHVERAGQAGRFQSIYVLDVARGRYLLGELSNGCGVRLNIYGTGLRIEPGDVLLKEWFNLVPVSANRDHGSGTACYTGYLSKFDSVTLTSGERGLRSYIVRLRWNIKKVLFRGLDAKDASLLSALILGNKHDLDPVAYKKMKELAVSHLVVVSGFQIVVLAWLLNTLLIPVLSGYRPRTMIVVLCLLVYTALCDFDAPVLRAFIMFVMYGVANAFYLSLSKTDCLSLAFAFIILINPGEAYSLSLYLSCLCVAGLIHIFPAIIELIDWRNRCRAIGMIWHCVAATLGAIIPLFPLLFYFFGTFSPYFIVSNLLIGTYISTCFVIGLLFIPLSGTVMAHPLGMILHFMCDIVYVNVDALHALPAAVVHIARPAIWAIAVYYALLVLIVLASKMKPRAVVFTGVLPLILLIMPDAGSTIDRIILRNNEIVLSRDSGGGRTRLYKSDRLSNAEHLEQIEDKVVCLRYKADIHDIQFADVIICRSLSISASAARAIKGKVIYTYSRAKIVRLLSENNKVVLLKGRKPVHLNAIITE